MNDLSVKMVMILLFVNIALTLALPDVVFSGNYFYEQVGDDVQISGQMQTTMGGINEKEEGLNLTDWGIIDVIQMLWGVIDLLISLFFASFKILTILPGTVALVIGVPLIICYGLAVWGFIK